MKKHEKALLFYDQLEQVLIFYGNNDTKGKMEFAKYFIDCLPINNLQNSRVSIGPMDRRTLQFLIFAILLEYKSVKEMGKPKRHEKDLFYMDTKEIFPGEEMTVEDVKFIEHCLNKLHIDLESDDNKEFVLSLNQLVFLLRGIMREYNLFVGNGGKFEE
jgi:hypothetical protein